MLLNGIKNAISYIGFNYQRSGLFTYTIGLPICKDVLHKKRLPINNDQLIYKEMESFVHQFRGRFIPANLGKIVGPIYALMYPGSFKKGIEKGFFTNEIAGFDPNQMEQVEPQEEAATRNKNQRPVVSTKENRSNRSVHPPQTPISAATTTSARSSLSNYSYESNARTVGEARRSANQRRGSALSDLTANSTNSITSIMRNARQQEMDEEFLRAQQPPQLNESNKKVKMVGKSYRSKTM
jgi:hypothetical protein